MIEKDVYDDSDQKSNVKCFFYKFLNKTLDIVRLFDNSYNNMLVCVSGYKTARLMAVPGGWDYYEVVFDQNSIVISQKITSYFDGL